MVPEFAPEKILAVLATHGVHFLVIGGYAAALHGSPFLTQDVDITPETTQRESREVVGGIRPFSHDAESLAAVRVWNLTTRYGDLDISFAPSGTEGFADLEQDATDEVIDGVAIRLASLADIIRSKQAANRPKDQRVLPTLRELLAARYEKESGDRPAGG